MKNSTQYMKDYYEKNKETFKTKYNRDIHCDKCNKDVKGSYFAKHCKSIKHINNSKTSTEITLDKIAELEKVMSDLKAQVSEFTKETSSSNN